MPSLPNKQSTSFQTQFHRRWNHLNDRHVRALAWLLDAPDLLDPRASQWHGRIASLPGCAVEDAGDWLATLDRKPEALHSYLGAAPYTRLGRYAEKLMAFYFQHREMLVAHGVQVRAGKNDTIGEFDFLLRQGDRLLHWEFATKFYLLESNGATPNADHFLGPNLADTLGAKMRKILDRQLTLAQHPAAQIHLPQKIAAAQALVKGWLFYRDGDPCAVQTPDGVSENHCRGFWCALGDFNMAQAEHYAVLPRLSWLAPAKIAMACTLDGQALAKALTSHFSQDTMPVMIAVLELQDGYAIETDRGFIVPDDWRSCAVLYR
jgi:hypothetical protein